MSPESIASLHQRSVYRATAEVLLPTQNVIAQLKAVRDAFSALEKFDATEIEATLKTTAANLGVKVGAIVHPTRLAVTGSNIGPSLYHLLEVLGKEKVLTRIDRALTIGR